MKCPWPVLRAAKAMRDAAAIVIEADDPIAPTELKALAVERGWEFTTIAPNRFSLTRRIST